MKLPKIVITENQAKFVKQKLLKESDDIKPQLIELLKSGVHSNLLLVKEISEGQGINFDDLLEEVFNLSFWIKNDWAYDDTSKGKMEIISELLIKTMMDISYRNLKEIPPSIEYFKNLEELDIHGNELESIPSTIGNLHNLQKLWIDGNYLTTLPNEICNLTNLQVLDVNNNLISALPNNIGNLQNLQVFWADNNYLQTIPESFFKLRNLNDVQFRWNDLKASELKKLKTFFELNNIEHDIE